ncbi:MAG TPA: methyltransferase domain-containing protein [Candidatus Dormibacteraeota bacterium]|nr:methyltransferase domain-containing protein [Candidatus Dormibacteraeota bacterium]
MESRYRLTKGGPRSTEQLVEAGRYGYAHSCVTSENFPARAGGGDPGGSEIIVIGFDHAVGAEEALAEAGRRGLERPSYEDALWFGIEHPDVQQAHPVVFLHDPWFGFFGRRDVLCLWSNAGRRELGLEGFDDTWSPRYRFAFVARGAMAASFAGRPEAGGPRPFYGQFAWAYDHLVERPVVAECAGIARTLARRGIGPGAALLDAGCGTGHYALELARLGFDVTGLDRSPALLEQAEVRARGADSGAKLRIEQGDILQLPAHPRYDAIVCRGVLNDFVDDGDRAAVFGTFARTLRAGGVLLLDVRDWDATVAGKTARPSSEKRVTTPRGLLVFRSITRLEPVTQRLLVSERHTLTTGAGETVVDHEFVMRCWSREELQRRLGPAGFGRIEYSSTYDGTPSLGAGDRIVAVASLTGG